MPGVRQINAIGNRVVVTGIGVVTPIGIGANEFWTKLTAGESGTTTITRFDASGYSCQVAGEVKGFNATDYVDSKTARRNDFYTLYAIAASKLAVSDAGISEEARTNPRIGAIIGSGIGGMTQIESQSKIFHTKGHRYISPFMIPSIIVNMASGIVGMELELKGANFGAVSACATGTHAIGEAYHMLKLGKADAMLAGGSEDALGPLSFSGFCTMRAMSTTHNDTPETASRPFDATRDGFVMGEGAGVLVLETLEHAVSRNARIYCEIIGYAASCDAYHITAPCPDGDGLVRCYNEIFAETGLAPKDIQYVNAHGTSTVYNDKSETAALKTVFKEHAKKLLVSSIKGATGHLLGATGAVEAAACAKTIETGIVPPTINYRTSDPDCDLNYVPNNAVHADVNVAVSENMGFGGQNAVLIFKKFQNR